MSNAELSNDQDSFDFNEILKAEFPRNRCLDSELKICTNKFEKIPKNLSPELLQLVVLGPSMHGKKRLLECFANRKLNIPVYKNIHFALNLSGFLLQGVNVQLQLWHVGNIKRSLEILQYLYKEFRTCFMLVYDVNDSTTFEDIREWIPSLRYVLDDLVPIVLVGYEDIAEIETSKLLPISYSDGLKTKEFFELASFFEFSDMTGSGVTDMFFEAAHIALESKMMDPDSELSEQEELNDS